jgi:hypothetical protein
MADEEAKSEPTQEEKTETTETTNGDNNILSPLEQAKAIQEENKKILEQMSEERKKMEKAAGEMIIGGGSFAGTQPTKPKTQAEIDEEDAMQIVKARGAI